MPYHRDTYKIAYQYNTVRTNLILKESFNSDVILTTHLLNKNQELCNEIFGQLGQKIKQGVQAGAQTVKNKLLKSLVDMVMNKLPPKVKQQVTQVASQGPDALQQYLQKNGDPNVAKQLASTTQQQPAQQQPATESVNRENLKLITLLGLINSDGNLLTEAKMSDRAKFSNFQKTLQKLSSEISDPQIKQQADSILTYIQNNYSNRGKLIKKPAQQQPAQQPAQQQPAQQPAQQQPAQQQPAQQQPAQQQPAQQPSQQQPAQQQGTNLDKIKPGLEVPDFKNPLPLKNEIEGKDNVVDSAIRNMSGFASKVTSLFKNNAQFNTQGLLGILLAIVVAAGGANIVAPLLAPESSSNPEAQIKSLLPQT